MAYVKTIQQGLPSLNPKLVGDVQKPYVDKLYLLCSDSKSHALHFALYTCKSILED